MIISYRSSMLVFKISSQYLNVLSEIENQSPLRITHDVDLKRVYSICQYEKKEKVKTKY